MPRSASYFLNKFIHVPISRLGERGLLERLRCFTAEPGNRLPVAFGDDAAVYDPDPERRRRSYLLATTDTMVQDTHFRPQWAEWDEIGCKLIASNVSDIAAMGGRPTLALISLACPPTMSYHNIELLYIGLAAESRRWGVLLAGGDTVRAEQVVLTLMLLGEKSRSAASAARDALCPGQRLFVTGWPGESGAGLALLIRRGRRAHSGPEWVHHLVARHLTPTPRPKAGQALAAAFPDLGMIDLSDGLDHELRLLAEASRVRLEIDLSALPVSPALVQFQQSRPEVAPLSYVCYGGEDYELLFAARAEWEEVARVLDTACPGLAVHEIGRVAGRSRTGVVNYRNDQRRIVAPPHGVTFEHFAPPARRTRKRAQTR